MGLDWLDVRVDSSARFLASLRGVSAPEGWCEG